MFILLLLSLLFRCLRLQVVCIDQERVVRNITNDQQGMFINCYHLTLKKPHLTVGEGGGGGIPPQISAMEHFQNSPGYIGLGDFL